MTLDPSAESALRGVIGLACIAAAVDALELGRLRAAFGTQVLGGLRPWPVDRPSVGARLQGLVPLLAAAEAVLLGLCLLVLSGSLGQRLLVACPLAAIAAAHRLTISYGANASDDMRLVTSIGTALGTAVGPAAWPVVLVAVAAQLLLAVSVAGLAKLGSPIWRSGNALVAVLSSESFGNRAVARRLGDLPPWLPRIAAYGVLAWELCFAMAVLSGPRWLAAAVLVFGLLFHAGTALVMRLWGLWMTFSAAYPAALWLAAAR